MFKRAEWHSGLTYKQTCPMCQTTVKYTDHVLDFRPWFADGFVYCPKCQKPLRHREAYAIDRPTENSSAASGIGSFCTTCGKKFGDGDAFCSGCGTKRS